jgi:hypothetical protein
VITAALMNAQPKKVSIDASKLHRFSESDAELRRGFEPQWESPTVVSP